MAALAEQSKVKAKPHDEDLADVLELLDDTQDKTPTAGQPAPSPDLPGALHLDAEHLMGPRSPLTPEQKSAIAGTVSKVMGSPDVRAVTDVLAATADHTEELVRKIAGMPTADALANIGALRHGIEAAAQRRQAKAPANDNADPLATDKSGSSEVQPDLTLGAPTLPEGADAISQARHASELMPQDGLIARSTVETPTPIARQAAVVDAQDAAVRAGLPDEAALVAKRMSMPEDIVDRFGSEAHDTVMPLLQRSTAKGGGLTTWRAKNNQREAFAELVKAARIKPATERTQAEQAAVYASDLIADTTRGGITHESKGPVLAQSIGVDTLKALVPGLTDKLSWAGLSTHVYRTLADVPEALRGDAQEANGILRVDEAGKPHVVLIADRIADAEHAKAIVREEVLGHWAFEDALNAGELASLRNAVARGAAKPGVLKDLLASVKRDYPLGDYTYADQINEVVAKVARDDSPAKGGVRDVLDTMNTLMVRLGLADRAMSYDALKKTLREVSYSYSGGRKSANRFRDKGYAGKQQEFDIRRGKPALARQAIDRVTEQFADQYAMVYKALDVLGAKTGPAAQLLMSRETRQSHLADGLIHDTLFKPVSDRLASVAKSTGESLDSIRRQFDEFMQAYHAPEVNDHLHRMYADLKPEAHARREKTINDYLAGRTNITEARTQLGAIVTDANMTKKGGRAAAKYSGMTDGDAGVILQRVRADGLHDVFDQTNRELVGPLRETITRLNHQAGHWDRRMTDLADYQYYVPRKGGHGEGRITADWTGGVSAINEGQRAAQGRADVAQHGLAGLLQEGRKAAMRTVDQQFTRSMADLVKTSQAHEDPAIAKRAGRLATISSAEPIRYESEGEGTGRFAYPARPTKDQIAEFLVYDAETGKHERMTLHDASVADALSKRFRGNDDDMLSGLTRGVAKSTRVVARLRTSANPAFLIRAFQKDVQTALGAAAFEQGELRAKALAAGGRAPKSTPVFNPSTLASTAKGIAATLANKDAWRMFGGTAGDQYTLAEQWSKGTLDAELERRFGQSPDRLQAAQESRKYLAEYVQNGGLTAFVNSVDQSLKRAAEGDPLLQQNVRARVGAAVAKPVEALERLGTVTDNTHRFGLYMALRKHGMDATEALIRVRKTMDFNQRSGFRNNDNWLGGYVAAVQPFVQSKLSAGQSQFARRIWRNGEAPTEIYELPDGTAGVRLREGWIKELNPLTFATYAGAGYASVMLASALMGQDENGEDEARKLAPTGWLGISLCRCRMANHL